MSFVDKVMYYKVSNIIPYISEGAILPITVILLILSNLFMSFAWYHHLKDKNMVFITALGISIIYVIFEYSCNIHANSIGFKKYDLYTLKILQEVITLLVFMVFAFMVFDEKPQMKHLTAFGLIMGAVYVALK